MPTTDIAKEQKTTIVMGATTNPARYAYLAAHRLKENHVPFIPVGIKRGEVAGEEIMDLREKPELDHVHTVTMYIGPDNQAEWIDYILSLKPKRIIFNPGSENPELANKAKAQGIEVVEGCTLVMLSIGAF